MKETKIQKRIAIALAKEGCRIWVNDNGLCYQGKVTRMGDGAVIKGCKAIKYGLGTGTSDLIGFTPVEITQEMVGQTLPIFTAIEVKTAKGRASAPQVKFIETISEHKGIAGIARSVEEAKEIIKNGIQL